MESMVDHITQLIGSHSLPTSLGYLQERLILLADSDFAFETNTLFCWLQQQCFYLTPNQYQSLATSQPAVLFSHSKSAPTTSHSQLNRVKREQEMVQKEKSSRSRRRWSTPWAHHTWWATFSSLYLVFYSCFYSFSFISKFAITPFKHIQHFELVKKNGGSTKCTRTTESMARITFFFSFCSVS